MVKKGRKSPSSQKISVQLSLGKRFGRLFVLVTVLVLAATAAYVYFLDLTVQEQFEGKRWALPAKVYASPAELYAGVAATPARFESLLSILKFREDAELSSQATYFRRGNEFTIKTREFAFWDKREPSLIARVRFSAGQIEALERVDDGSTIPILRMEPAQIGSFYPKLKEDRILVKLDNVPKQLVDALIAVEDRNFYSHFGVSVKAIARAMWANVRAGGIVQGGSTLTQQLVKNFYLSSERTLARKVNEVLMSFLLEFHYSKQEILEAYLNEIYLGQDGARAIHGFGLASQYYFSRSVEELELHHIALLIALVRGPTYYDPFQSPERAKKRRDMVLAEMADLNFISPDQAKQAEIQPLDVVADAHQAISRYPAFLDLVKRQLQKEYRNDDLTSDGLRIFTTLDVEAQDRLESSVEATITALGRQTKSDRLEAAAIITRRAVGEVAALVGSRNPRSTGFNRALDAVRQIGSLYKPVVYLSALANPQKYTLISELQDRSIRVANPGSGKWRPKNFDNREHGPVPLHTALAHSYNLATVSLGLSIGVEQTLKTMHSLGVDRPMDAYPATLLGTGMLTPFEVTQLYQTLASDGFVTPLQAIRAVVSQDGKPLQRYALKVKQAVDPAAVYLVNTAMQEVMREGTGKPVYRQLPETLNVAGKTGTTNDLNDSWFAGFTGDYLGVAWIGRDDNQSVKLTGAQGALRLWTMVMKSISREALELEQPDNVEWVWIDKSSGSRVGEGCPTGKPYPFIQGSAPQEVSSCGSEGEPTDDATENNPIDEAGDWFKELF